MGIMVRERAHESALMEQRRGDESFCSEQLMPEPQLPSGWEKCLDLKSGLVYFKDWNSGTLTYRDPRRSAPVTTQRIGLLSISLSHQTATPAVKPSSNAANEGISKSLKRERSSVQEPVAHRFSSSTVRLPWDYSAATQAESPATETTTSMDEHSLELSLNLPGTSTSRPGTTSSQEGSVCTMEKVRSALERSQWLKPLPRKRASPSRESSSPVSRLHLESSSPSTSQSSASECFTSPSVMSYQGDDEEVQQPRECRDSGSKCQVLFGKQESDVSPVMVTVGCKRCLMYVMLSKSHPSCPKCGNTDVLLELPAPLPKRKRISLESPSWSWSTA
ncbi:hypothetical protein M758_6G100600 [Ceratodon purpureus]|uniref:WW domain-containing protein n=1 Tax=Ceratodon purpureus TaxID=3225 RepID=A0A8T0HDP2_CERPU|nr:hypothetical protein KC19_6G104400 [Ceratodon purpureus]KAG0613409.1 hypothetical protein M758_6G100600 [Ceratodon purpureus]